MRSVTSIKIDKIVVSFFVRRQLSEARVSQLIKLIEGGTKLPPIKVWFNEKTENYEVIDGRHRLEANKRLEYTTIESSVISEPDFAKRVGMAIACNSNGPLTPTDEDFEVALQALLDAGTGIRRICEIFPLPKAYTVRLIHNIRSKLHKVAVTQAVEAVANQGLTVKKAADQFGVDIGSIKQRITGKQKVEKEVVTDFTGGFSHRFRSFSARNGEDCRKMIDAYYTGKLTVEAVRSIFKTVVRSAKNAVSVVEDYQNRFETIVGQDKEKAQKGAA